MNRPSWNRFRPKASVSGDRPLAISSAMAQPEPGIALNPPVPQPQLTNTPSTGVFDRIGERSPRHIHNTAPLAQHLETGHHREGLDQGAHRFLDMVERAALGVVVIAIRPAADHHLTLVGLAHVAMHRIGHDHDIHAGFDRL